MAVSYFTELLPGDTDSKQLQWSLNLPYKSENINPKRGNRPYASLDLKGQWLSKEGFLHFTGMRQFPNMVLRKMCVALEEESLPFHHDAVQTLLRQSLFQIGDIEVDNGKVLYNWRRDYDDIRATCSQIVHGIGDIHAEKPNVYRSLIILAQIASYLVTVSSTGQILKAQEAEKLRSMTLKLAKKSFLWGQDKDEDIKDAQPEFVPSLRSKQVIFFRIAILCLVHHDDLNEEEACLILKSCARACNTFVEEDDDSIERENLKSACDYFLSKIKRAYSRRIEAKTNLLTEALKHVIISCPAFLPWQKDANSQVSFNALGSDGHYYSFNILSGVVLVNGLPPNQLPTSITDDDRYRKVFGNNNFEVILKSGIYETLRPMLGCFYSFHKSKDGKSLVIRESSDQRCRIEHENRSTSRIWDDCLELLDERSIDAWGMELPEKLKVSYSHWASRSRGKIVFREFDFRKRTPSFIHDIQMGKCQRIPNIKNTTPVVDANPNNDMLVLHKSPIITVLKRFESTEMIHTFRVLRADSDKDFCSRFELYRFGLSFTHMPKSPHLDCDQIAGHRLAPTQHISGAFSGLQQYLVLQSSTTRIMKLIIPFGRVEASNGDGGVKITLLNAERDPASDRVEDDIKFFEYDINPRLRNLVAKTLSARLYLATLYFASALCIPDEMLGTTGEAKAIEIIRQCWSNRPLSGEEKYCLENLMSLSLGKSPSLSLLCQDLKRSTTEFHFLHNQYETSSTSPPGNDPTSFSVDVSAYRASLLHPISSRLLLTSGECQRLFGCNAPRMFHRTDHIVARKFELGQSPIVQMQVDKFYKSIDSLWDEEERYDPVKKFPLEKENSRHDRTNLEKDAYKELQDSWNLHCKEECFQVVFKDEIMDSMRTIRDNVREAEQLVLEYIFRSLGHSGGNGRSTRWHAKAIQFFRIMNMIPNTTKRDIASMACYPMRMREFNPLLSTESIGTLRTSIIHWLELCVLEDKCTFLLSFKGDVTTNKDFLRELSSQRQWDVHEHPYWLVYEMEQGIRIRPEQYEITNRLVNNAGDVVQLNMGLGKTRVILPMLILFYSFQEKYEYIPRLCILSTLLTEVCDHFHNTLSASVLGKRLFLLPFQRDVDINKKNIKSLIDLVSHCKVNRGFFVVAPEHRLSLQLKVKEMHLTGNNLSKELNEIVHSPWFDIFDEVDEILHHRYQLVYSIGAVKPLPQMIHRWRAAQALLQVLKTISLTGIKIARDNDNLCEAFPHISVGDEINVIKFRFCITQLLLASPPRELNWLKLHPKQDEIFNAISCPSDGLETLILSDEHLNDVLALRGLIAYDILLHCLKKRHRVNYGINPEGRKALAVPFRGADTPSRRSEFSHPDCAIVQTQISYYEQGLTRSQVKSSFDELLRKGQEARRTIYVEWLDVSGDRIASNDYESISKVEKIDMTNDAQFDILFKYYQNNYRTINFWLNNCVYPAELDLYPERLVANSWHLASNSNNRVVGFSGTNDNHKILPLQVKQHLPWNTTNRMWCKLLATNGKMLDVIIERTKKCIELPEGVSHVSLLNFIKSSAEKQVQVDALIDAGALLAGRSNRDIAQTLIKEYLFREGSPSLKGVTFFDTDTGSWMILEQSSRCLPKDQSPLHERDTFTLFDEPRCRGVDLKLRPEAVAVLTLGQDMCKDKFMQAAGRMRQLHADQSIIIVGEKKVFSEIQRAAPRDKNTYVSAAKAPRDKNIFVSAAKASSFISKKIIDLYKKVDTVDILSWIMKNTVDSVVKGLGMWADHGIFFNTELEPRHAVLEENQSLEEFYMNSTHDTPLVDVVLNLRRYHCSRTGSKDATPLMNNIVSRVEHLGKDYCITRSVADEECERELEREVEEEEQVQIEFDRMDPRIEVDWDYSSIFSSNSCTEVSTAKHLLSTVVQKFVSNENVRNIMYSDKVFCTENFIHTCTIKSKSAKGDYLDSVLRIPDCFIRFPCGDILLLSDREGALILPSFIDKELDQSQTIASGLYFGHYAFETIVNSDRLPFLRVNSHSMQATAKRRKLSAILPFHSKISLDEKDSCSLKLFNGDTMYPGSLKRTLKGMLSHSSEDLASSGISNIKLTLASGEPEAFVERRGKLRDYDMSDLENISKEIACEMDIRNAGAM